MIKSGRLRLTCDVAGMDEGRGAYNIVTGKPTEHLPLERLKGKWEDNIRKTSKK